jgi:ketosteroid isomerase-like protein
MKVMTHMLLAIILVAIWGAWAAQAAENWTAEQKEVWAVEEKIWNLTKPSDVPEMLLYYHPDYMGWAYSNPTTSGKEYLAKWMPYWMSTGEMIMHEITPLTIWVKGNFAYVHYYYTEVDKDKKGEEKMHKGRWTDILVKENGKWLFIGDHGGEGPSK